MPKHTLIFGDTHNYPPAVGEALESAEIFADRPTWTLRKGTRDDLRLVGLGDYLDNDPAQGNADPVGVLEMLTAFHEQLGKRFVALLGNHCAALFDALQTGSFRSFSKWMSMGGKATLKAFCAAKNLEVRDPNADTPVPPPLERLFPDNPHNARPHWEQHWPDELDGREGFLQLQQLILRGKYAWLFEQCRLMHRIAKDVLVVHAGVDDYAAGLIASEGTEGIHRRLWALKQGNLSSIVHKEDPLAQVIRMRANHFTDNKILTPVSGALLKKAGINVLIRGHQIASDGKQNITEEHGILRIDADVGGYLGNSGCVEVLSNGRIRTWNAKEGWKVVRE